MLKKKEINNELRTILFPTLKEYGFEKVSVNNSWQWSKDCIFVFNISNVGNYFSEVTGWTPLSLTATLGVFYSFIPLDDENIKVGKKGELLPSYDQCHRTFDLRCSLDQSAYLDLLDNPAEKNRNDIWWIDLEGENLSDVIRDIKKSFVIDGIPWLDQYTNLEYVFSEIEKENDSYNKFYKAKYFAKHLNKKDKFIKYSSLFEVEKNFLENL